MASQNDNIIALNELLSQVQNLPAAGGGGDSPEGVEQALEEVIIKTNIILRGEENNG